MENLISFDTRRYIKGNDYLNMIRVPTTKEQVDGNLEKVVFLLEDITIAFMKIAIEVEEEGSSIYMELIKKILELGIYSGIDLLSEEPIEVDIEEGIIYNYQSHTHVFKAIDKFLSSPVYSKRGRFYKDLLTSYLQYLNHIGEFYMVKRVMGEYFKEV